MGRLPDKWANRVITMRIPYSMEGELIVPGSASGKQFPDATFTNNVDMPFEIHRAIPRVTGLDASNNVQPNQMPQDTISEFIRMRINDFGKNALLTKNPSLINTLTKGQAERTWEFADPYYLVRSEGLQVVCDSLALPVWDGAQVVAAPPNNALANFRIELVFQGFLLQVAPPSNTR